MHYDSDAFNCLYVIEGRKRVVVIPNDRRTSAKLQIETNEDGGTGWTGLDILFDMENVEQLLNGPSLKKEEREEDDDDDDDDDGSSDDSENDEAHEDVPIIEVILEPGQAIIFPYLAWHAVENLEPSLAVSLRIL